MEKKQINWKENTTLIGIKESLLLSLKEANGNYDSIIIEIKNCRDSLTSHNLQIQFDTILQTSEIKNYIGDLNKQEVATNKPKKKNKF